MPENTEKVNWPKNVKIFARVAQGIFFGVFLLGVSMIFGDLAPIIDLPISPLSMTTTVYGVLGMIACEFVAWRAGRSEES